MKPRLLALVAIGLLLGLGGGWLALNLERVERTIPTGPSAAALANPYLAAMRFSERIGWTAALEEQPARVRDIPVRTTVLLPAERAWLTGTRARELLRAVELGSHLIVAPERTGRRDALLDQLGIARRNAAPQAESFEVQVPGGEEPLRLATLNEQLIDPGSARADLVLADARGPRIASMPRGAGRITVIATMRSFDNRHIGRHDHAELLRRVLAFTPGERLLVVRAAATPAWWQWLVSHASHLMAGAVLLAVCALWRALPRFGPVLPAPQPERRQLLEHLRAAGRFRWSQGARTELLAAAREEVQRHVAAAAPRLAHVAAPQRYRALADQLDTDSGALQHAFESAPRNARELVQAAATLASIHAGLRRVRRPLAPRRKRT